MSRDRVQWLGTPLLVALAVVSVSLSLYHIVTHQAPLLPTVLGQWSLLGMSVVFCGSIHHGLTRTESGAERATIGRRGGAGYALAAVASASYAFHQYLTPQVVQGVEALVFQALFMAVAGGIAGVFLGLEKVKRDRTLDELTATTQQLERTVARLDQSNEQLAEFAYVASHDLQEPARMVASYVDLLATVHENPDETTAEYLEFAEDGAREMLSMIDALQNYYQTASRELRRESVDTAAVFMDVVDTLEPEIQDAGVTVTADELPTVEGDARQLQDVFEQLLDNALEHGAGVTEIQVSATRTGDECRFSVADDGAGGLSGDPGDLFHMFADGGADTGGPGIGLAMCEHVVTQHGGEIWIESDEMTTVRFTIPLADTQPELPVGVGAASD